MNKLRSISFSVTKTSDSRSCKNCDHFNNDPALLEEHFQGINILSSVRGSSRGDGGICRLHDQYLLPMHTCPEFVRKL